MTAVDGIRILIVEDEYLLARQLERGLTREGAVVVGAVPSVARALALLEGDPAPCVDVAVLDVNLSGEKSYPVADLLLARGVPFIFASGYEPGECDARYEAFVHVAKPLTIAALVAALRTALAHGTTAQGDRRVRAG